MALRARPPGERHRAWSKARLVVHEEECADCSGCVAACPHDALTMEWRSVTVDPAKCTLCGVCVRVCPVTCIEIERVGVRDGEPAGLPGLRPEPLAV